MNYTWKNKELNKFYNHKFDFDNQYKNTYNDWLKAFENSIKERGVGNCFIGLSSGYDSGVLANELLKQNIKFKSFVNFNNENEKVLDKRLKNLSEYEIVKMGVSLYLKYRIFLNNKISDTTIRDKAFVAIGCIFDKAKKEGRDVFLSGQGADEIYSDYSLFPRQSTFKGTYPDILYEWPNFRNKLQLQYITGLEEVAKIYGIEVHYPFLDIDLIQEFLWLRVELKNKNYKAPLFEYLIKNNVVFDKEVKKGFQPIHR